MEKNELRKLLERYLNIEVDLNCMPTSPEYSVCNIKIYFDGHLICEDTSTRLTNNAG